MLLKKLLINTVIQLCQLIFDYIKSLVLVGQVKSDPLISQRSSMAEQIFIRETVIGSIPIFDSINENI